MQTRYITRTDLYDNSEAHHYLATDLGSSSTSPERHLERARIYHIFRSMYVWVKANIPYRDRQIMRLLHYGHISVPALTQERWMSESYSLCQRIIKDWPGFVPHEVLSKCTAYI